MATLLVKSFPSVDALSLATFPVNDSKPANLESLNKVLDENIDLLSKRYVSVMPGWMRAKFFDLESERQVVDP